MSKSFLFEQSYVSVDQLKTKKQVESIFKLADKMKKVVEQGKVYEPLKGKCVAILFYQPSTRTFSSFEASARRLGAYTIAIHGMTQYSSVSKGESLSDTIKSIYQTTGANLIVLRHPGNDSSQIASTASYVPVINGGSGTKEHPTQALLDLYTIDCFIGKTKKLKVVMVGDLLYGRTTKSLAKLLAVMDKNTEVVLVSPSELKAPASFVKSLKKKIKVVESQDLIPYLKSADVVYMTRVQKEWFIKAGKLEEYEKVKNALIMTRHMATRMKKKAIIMHPLPRVGEILAEVDQDHHSKYFEQMRSGLYIRMALLEAILVR